MAEDCIFCKIGRGDIPSSLLDRDDRVFVIRDINPKAPTHLLVVPIEHVTYLASFTQDREACWDTCCWWQGRWRNGRV